MTYVQNRPGTRALTLTIGETEWSGDVTGARIATAAADSDAPLTFEDARSGGGRQYSLVFTGVADYQAASLWDLIWSNAGDTVAFILGPYGDTYTATTPGFSGNAVIAEADGDLIGTDANASTAAQPTFDASWVCTAKPTRITEDPGD